MRIPLEIVRDVESALPATRSGSWADEAARDLSRVYRDYFSEVCRWARAMGAAETDLEDVAQEVFLVVRRRLADFDGQNLAGWLFRITERAVKDHRRSAWFRHIFQRPSAVGVEVYGLTETLPSEELERREDERELWQIIGKLSEKRRTAFVLFEIEGYSGEAIAELLGLPVATVWTRLHHARRDFNALLAKRRTETPR